jgi:hypothetical protein
MALGKGRQPASKKVAMKKCFRQRGSSKGKRGTRKPGFIVKGGQCYQVRKYRKCAKKRAVAMHQGVAVVAPCGHKGGVTKALRDRAWNTYSQANWSKCAARNRGKTAKTAPCRVIFFKATGEPIMRGKTAGAKLKRQAKARWAKRPATFRKKFARGGFRK